jgi:hypothetical protein
VLLLISILFSVMICLVVVGILSWVKTPYYRPSRADTTRLLEWMLLGQATETDWQFFCGYPIRHDPLLEEVRQRCQDIDERCFIGDNRDGVLLNRQGLSEVRELLERLKRAPEEEG